MKKLITLAVFLIVATGAKSQVGSFKEYKRKQDSAYKAYQKKEKEDFERFRAEFMMEMERQRTETMDALERMKNDLLIETQREKQWDNQTFETYKKQVNKDFKGFQAGLKDHFNDLKNEKKILPPVDTNFMNGLNSNWGTIPLEEFDSGVYHAKNGAINTPQEKKKKSPTIDHTDLSYRVNFYGLPINLFAFEKTLPLHTIAPNTIQESFEILNSKRASWLYILEILATVKKKTHLNDFGYYLLVKKASEKIFKTKNEQRLVACYLMRESGYNTAVAFENNNLYIIATSRNKIFGHKFAGTGATKIVFLNGDCGPSPKLQQLSTANHSKKNISLQISELPQFPFQAVSSKNSYIKQLGMELQFNQNILNYLNDYPSSDINIYWFNDISRLNMAKIVDRMYSFWDTSSTYQDAVNDILTFCQNIDYQVDNVEHTNTAYETLQKEASDCEDKAILCAILIEQCLGLPTILLKYDDPTKQNPGHVAVGVHFPKGANGKSYAFREKQYWYCDPTNDGYQVGQFVENLAGLQQTFIPSYK